MLKTTTCRHFNGTANKTCDKGIPYESVAQPTDHGVVAPMYALAYPCIPHGLPLGEEVMARLCCTEASYPTKEEEEADEARTLAVIKAHFEDIKNDICPTHKVEITKVQVGKCVYAEPCGCRLYQGKLKKKRPGRNAQ